MSHRHPAHRPPGMVWIAVHGDTILGALEAAVDKFDKWGIVHNDSTDRALLINGADFDRLAGQIDQRRRGRRLFSRPPAGGVLEARDWLAEHLNIDRVVITELFGQPILRHDEGDPQPAAEATLVEVRT